MFLKKKKKNDLEVVFIKYYIINTISINFFIKAEKNGYE